jgi:cobalt/nickel transport system permease protein
LNSLEPQQAHSELLCRIDPRAKLIAFTAIIAAIALTPPSRLYLLGFYGVLLVAFALTAQVPAGYLIKHTAVTLPFVVPAILFLPLLHGGESLAVIQIGSWHLTVSSSGTELAGSILGRAWLSVMFLSILMSSTGINGILDGLERLRTPKIMISLLEFMYRYLFVIGDEARRLKTGRDLRYFGGSLMTGIRSVGYMAGSLFLRSYERGDRVYSAMLLRGYDGTSRSLSHRSFKSRDALFVACGILLVAAINLSVLWI